jgi:hypothetical protein
MFVFINTFYFARGQGEVIFKIFLQHKTLNGRWMFGWIFLWVTFEWVWSPTTRNLADSHTTTRHLELPIDHACWIHSNILYRIYTRITLTVNNLRLNTTERNCSAFYILFYYPLYDVWAIFLVYYFCCSFLTSISIYIVGLRIYRSFELSI